MDHEKYFGCVLLFLLYNAVVASCTNWAATFDPVSTIITTGITQRAHLILSELSDETVSNIQDSNYVRVRSQNEQVASIRNQNEIEFSPVNGVERSWETFFVINGVFLGKNVRQH